MRSGEPDLLRSSLQHLRLGIDGLRQCAHLGLDADSLSDLLGSVLAHRNQLDSAVTEIVGSLDQRVEERRRDHGDQDDPTTSCAVLLRDDFNLTNGAAHAQVRLARQLRQLPDTAAAFSSGRLSYQHALSLARTVDRVVLGGGRAQDAEPLLLQQAEHRNPHELLMWGRHLRHRLNPTELADEEEQEHERQWLHLTRTWSGGYDLEGHLDAEAGVILKEAIEGVLGPRQKDDRRPAGRRRAEGLVDLARRCLDSGELPVRGGVRPHITITATLETLRGDPGAPAAELDWGFPISGEMLRRIACDADLTPILLSAGGSPLHVGRTRRTATPRMRRALAARDRHCVWPGCDRPPTWCDGHHTRWWSRGGITAVDEMSLLCGRHHRKVHRGHRLVRGPDGHVQVIPPPPRQLVS